MEKSNSFTQLDFKKLSKKTLIENSTLFFESMNKRRSIREFSAEPVPKEIIENLIKTASTAPSGAHKQPWTFCAISNKEIKTAIREAAEIEEKLSYEGRMSDAWLKDLEPFGTTWQKPMLEDAPWLIVVFLKSYAIENGEQLKNYYVKESVGLAVGFLLAAIHQAGLCSLTHTPSPMAFLSKILKRPENEKAFLLIPIGYPAEDCKVPVLERKSLEEVSVFYE